MYQTNILSTFGREFPAGDANGTSVTLHNQSPARGDRRKFWRAGAVAIVLSCLLPVALHGQSAALVSLSCSTNLMSGAGTDSCSVYLSGPPGNGVNVSLSSSDPAVTVPASVFIGAAGTFAGFTATVSAVTTTQTTVLSAVLGSSSETFPIQMLASAPTQQPALSLNTSSLSFGSVNLNTTTTHTVTVTSSGSAALTISGAGVSGTGFALSGSGLPVTLSPGQTATISVQFDPATAGAASGKLSIYSNAASGGTATVTLSGTGTGGSSGGSGGSSQSSISPAPGSVLPGATVNFTWPESGAISIYQLWLGTTPGAGDVGVYAVVSIAGLTASISATGIPTTGATLYARLFSLTTAGNWTTADYTYTEASPGGSAPTQSAGLSLSSTSVAFGNVSLNTTATQTVTLTSTGTGPVTISSAVLSGGAFSLSGVSFPLTLNPGAKATLNVAFDPLAAGGFSGSIILTSTASTGGTSTISLSGTGLLTAYEVNLSWNPGSGSSDPNAVASYNIYRASGSNGAFQLLNNSAAANYTDNNVSDGSSYQYEVTSVDSAGNESSPSNVYSVNIP